MTALPISQLRGGGVKIEVFSDSLIIWKYLLLLMQDINTMQCSNQDLPAKGHK